MQRSDYNFLVNSLKLLSLSYKDQVKCLPDFIGDSIQDDVISEFDNAFKLIPQLMSENKLSYVAVKEILSCYILIDMNINNMDMNDESFKSAGAWNKVRRLAKDVLKEMEEPLSFPDNIISD